MAFLLTLAHTNVKRPIRGRGGVIGPWKNRRVPGADYLFNESDLRGALEAHEKRMHDEIDAIDGDEGVGPVAGPSTKATTHHR
jgi:hypothetical protein